MPMMGSGGIGPPAPSVTTAEVTPPVTLRDIGMTRDPARPDGVHEPTKMDENSSDIIPPRRKSATQASRAFADQLDSSDGDSQLGGSDGEATKKKKTKKKTEPKKGVANKGSKLQTYGKRGKALKAAPLTSAIAVSKLEVELLEVEPSPRAPKPKPKPKQIVKRKRSPSLSILSSTPMKQTRISVPVGATETGIQTNASDNEIPLLHTTSPEPFRKRARASQASPASSPTPDILSDLTSLSASVGPGSPDSEIEILSFTPAVLNPAETAGIASTQVAPSHGWRHRVEHPWTSQNLGCYVWVLIEPTIGRVVDNKDQSQDESCRMWWPGKITSPRPTETPLRVKLYGQRSVVIHEPSEANIVSKLDALGRWRYQSPFFVSSPLQQIPSPSVKKLGNESEGVEQNHCEELQRRWKNAVIEMKQAEEAEQDSDYLPDVGEISSWATSGLSLSQDSNKLSEMNGNGKRKGKRKRHELSDEDVAWEPPPPDDNLQIPGELVLARENPGRSASVIHSVYHWPAKILGYKAPKHRKQQPKYLVKWLDGSEGEISRSCFYTVDEEEFALCKLGPFESSVVEVENDDESEDLGAFKARWDFSRRSPSPETIDPPPSVDDFKQLPIRIRFAYAKPVLTAILNKRYEPVLELHQLFMAGGQKRGRLLDHSSRRGKMDLKEVTELTSYLKEWCLRPPVMIPSNMNDQENDVQNDVKDTVEQDEVMAEQILPENPKSEIANPLNLVGYDSRSPSPPITELVPSSPPEMPPSSSFLVEPESPLMSDSLPGSPHRPVMSPLSVAENGMVPDIFPADIPDVLDINDFDRTMYWRERLPRQRGCEEYEALSDLDKLNYCTTILLPESIRQILLWQNGMRTSFELLSQELEQELYEKGEILLSESEWVFNVKRMRQRAEELLKRNGTGKRRALPVDYRE